MAERKATIEKERRDRHHHFAAATDEELLPQHRQQVDMDMVQTTDVMAVMERGERGGNADESMSRTVEWFVGGE